MAQKLVLPFTKSVISAGYRHLNYTNYWGYQHYGWDMGSDEANNYVKALGVGKIITVGYDNQLGNVLIVQYDNVILNNKKTTNLICRMYHLKQSFVKVGQQVIKGDRIAEYGKTGAGGWGIHLHIEFDTDTGYPNYAPGVRGANIIKRGIATTIVAPGNVFNMEKGQVLRVCPGSDGKIWSTKEETTLPSLVNRCPTCGREL